jgi:hypothetical protein
MLFDGGLVYSPGVVAGLEVRPTAFVQFWGIALDESESGVNAIRVYPLDVYNSWQVEERSQSTSGGMSVGERRRTSQG